jgi:hypothetical protein
VGRIQRLWLQQRLARIEAAQPSDIPDIGDVLLVDTQPRSAGLVVATFESGFFLYLPESSTPVDPALNSAVFREAPR